MRDPQSCPPEPAEREVAELLEIRHDSVKRSIERLAESSVVTLPPLVETSFLGADRTSQRTTEALAETGVISHPQIEDVQEVGGNNRCLDAFIRPVLPLPSRASGDTECAPRTSRLYRARVAKLRTIATNPNMTAPPTSPPIMPPTQYSTG